MTYTELYLKALVKWLKTDRMWAGIITLLAALLIFCFGMGNTLVENHPERYYTRFEQIVQDATYL